MMMMMMIYVCVWWRHVIYLSRQHNTRGQFEVACWGADRHGLNQLRATIHFSMRSLWTT